VVHQCTGMHTGWVYRTNELLLLLLRHGVLDGRTMAGSSSGSYQRTAAVVVALFHHNTVGLDRTNNTRHYSCHHHNFDGCYC
jgi:hypothetical protein